MGCASSSPVGPPSKALKLLTAAVTADDEYKGPKPPTSSEKAAAQEVLSLKGCTLATSWQANAVAAVVPHMKALKKIDLSGCQFGGQGSLAVFGAFAKGQPEGLTVLNLAANWQGAGGPVMTVLAKSLQAGNFQSLTSLDLSYNAVGGDGMAALATALTAWKPPLQKLAMADCQIGASGCKSLVDALLTLPSAANSFTLDLFSNQAGKQGGADLGRAFENGVAFQYLSTKDCAFGSDGVVEFATGLAKSPKLDKLESLDLSSSGVGIGDEQGCVKLAEAFETAAFPSLKQLNLAENSLYDGYCDPLLKSLTKLAPALTWIDLACNRLRGPEGLTISESMKSLTSLKTIGLNENFWMGDDAMAAILTSAADLPKLSDMHFCNTGAGPKAAEAGKVCLATKKAAGYATLADADPDKPPLLIDLRENKDLTAAVQEELKAAGATVGRVPGDTAGAKALVVKFTAFEWKGDSLFVIGEDEGGQANQAKVSVG